MMMGSRFKNLRISVGIKPMVYGIGIGNFGCIVSEKYQQCWEYWYLVLILYGLYHVRTPKSI